MAYYVVCNEHVKKITTNAQEYNKLVKRKTCHKKFNNENDAIYFLKTFDLFFKNRYNAFIDFEFTCTDKLSYFKFPYIQGEVLSIGICITDNTGNIVDTFYSTVKPKYNNKLTDYCINLTNLKQEDIDDSKDLISVILDAIDFIKHYNIAKLNAYGTSDSLQSIADIMHYKDSPHFKKAKRFLNKVFNIQPDFTKCLLGFKTEISLSDSKMLCNVSGDVKHNALSDAIDLSKIVFSMFYNTPSYKKINQYIKFREERIKYKQTRRFKKERFDFEDSEKEQIVKICDILENNCGDNNIAIKALIDDLLFISKQGVRYEHFTNYN